MSIDEDDPTCEDLRHLNPARNIRRGFLLSGAVNVSRTDWAIAVAMAFPTALLLLLVGAIRFFG